LGIWLTAEQKRRLPELITGLVQAKISRLVTIGTNLELHFLRVDPCALKSREEHRLYVVQMSVAAANPKIKQEFFAVTKQIDSPQEDYVYFLRVGCAVVQKLSNKKLEDLIMSRTTAVNPAPGTDEG